MIKQAIALALLVICVLVWVALAFSCVFMRFCNVGLDWLGAHCDDLED